MTYNQRSLRWHRRRAYAQMVRTHCDQDLDASTCNETVTEMLEDKLEDAFQKLRDLHNEKDS
jgi:hypothetical protein